MKPARPSPSTSPPGPGPKASPWSIGSGDGYKSISTRLSRRAQHQNEARIPRRLSPTGVPTSGFSDVGLHTPRSPAPLTSERRHPPRGKPNQPDSPTHKNDIPNPRRKHRPTHNRILNKRMPPISQSRARRQRQLMPEIPIRPL